MKISWNFSQQIKVFCQPRALRFNIEFSSFSKVKRKSRKACPIHVIMDHEKLTSNSRNSPRNVKKCSCFACDWRHRGNARKLRRPRESCGEKLFGFCLASGSPLERARHNYGCERKLMKHEWNCVTVRALKFPFGETFIARWTFDSPSAISTQPMRLFHLRQDWDVFEVF